MKKILIPTDFSDNSKNAIRYALELFKEKPCHFFIIYVNIEGSDFIEKPLYKFGTNVVVEKRPKDIAIKLKELKDFVTSISVDKNQHQFTMISERGHFLKSIRQQIQEKEIELIVMGTKGASELKEFFM
jgi:nucleotide-binding universal stress UspA family protein